MRNMMSEILIFIFENKKKTFYTKSNFLCTHMNMTYSTTSKTFENYYVYQNDIIYQTST